MVVCHSHQFPKAEFLFFFASIEKSENKMNVGLFDDMSNRIFKV